MRDREALLKAIIANPDEDTPRLALADWLDENRPDKGPTPAAGPSAWAEFIRVQCRLASATPGDTDYADLLDKEDDLGAWLDAHAPEKPKLPSGLQLDDDSCRNYVRGFPNRASKEYGSTDRRAIAKLCRAIRDAAQSTTARALRLYAYTVEQMAELLHDPAVEMLRALYLQPTEGDEGDFLDLDDGVAEWVPQAAGGAEAICRAVAESPHVRHLHDLRLFFPLTDGAAELLTRAKHLDTLTSFTADLSSATPAAIRSLGRAGWFRNLRTLHLSSRLNDEMLIALAALPPFPTLTRLDLSENWFTATGVARLAASKAFPNLAALDLSRMPLDAAAIRALAKAKWRLGELNLRACNFRAAGAEALAASRLLAGVKVCDLAANGIGYRGVKALAECPHAAGLRHLDLGFNHPLGKSGLLAIAKSPHLRGLTRLDLAEHIMGRAAKYAAKDLAIFLSRLAMPNLRALDLGELPVGAGGAQAIATSPSFAQLTCLDLSGCRIPGGAFKAMLESPHLRRLIDVNLANNRIGASAAALADRAAWPLLSKCNLYGNKIPRADARRLTRARRGLLADTD
jgi:uncharacterized protein (TIGR02996 family)